MNNEIILSIIIPCYNSADFIADTLDMLISQNLQNCEVIVINDGSEDKTSLIVHSYVEKFISIKIIDKQNEGVSVARNIGIENSSGKFILFLDSDDSYAPSSLKHIKDTISRQSDADFFAFGYTQKRDTFVKTYTNKNLDNKILNHETLLKLFLSKKINFNICSCVFSKSFLITNKILFQPGLAIGEDLEFLLKVLKYGKRCLYSAHLCFIYKLRENSVMQGYKSFGTKNYKSYLVRKNFVLANFYDDKLKFYSNFWINTQLLSHLIMYFKSDCADIDIKKNFLGEPLLFRNRIAKGNLKIFLALKIAKIIPINMIINKVK